MHRKTFKSFAHLRKAVTAQELVRTNSQRSTAARAVGRCEAYPKIVLLHAEKRKIALVPHCQHLGLIIMHTHIDKSGPAESIRLNTFPTACTAACTS